MQIKINNYSYFNGIIDDDDIVVDIKGIARTQKVDNINVPNNINEYAYSSIYNLYSYKEEL